MRSQLRGITTAIREPAHRASRHPQEDSWIISRSAVVVAICSRLPEPPRRSAALGFPAIVRSQSETVRIGHLTPRTGFLGPLGEYAVMGVNLAVDEINAAGGIIGRKIELIAEDSVNPQTASTKAERLIERDKVRRHHRRNQLGVGPRDRAGRAAQPHPVLQHRLQLRRIARQVVQPLHVPHRSRQQHVRRAPRGRRCCATGWSRARSGTA